MLSTGRRVQSTVVFTLFAGVALGQSPTTRDATPQAGTANADKPAPTWVDQVKHPTNWLKWGADLRIRYEYINNQGLDQSAVGHEWSVARFRSRIWADITPVQNFDLNMRLVREDRHWETPDSKPDWDWPDTTVDTANLKLSHLFDGSSSLTLGRQDIMNLGDGWLIFEGTPLDGSRSLFFDAARLTLADLFPNKTSLDLVFIQNYSDPEGYIPTIGERDIPLVEQDERGGIVCLTNRAIDKTQIDGYFIYKHDDRQLVNGDDSDLYTLGGRVARELSPHWKGRGEGAYQFGHRLNPVVYPDATSGAVSAWAFLGRVSYLFGDSMKNQLRFTFEHESGDDPDTATNEAFDPLWGRWPQFSEIWLYNARTETRVGETTNLTRASFGWQMNPTSKMEICAEYSLLFADENTFAGRSGFSKSGSFRGQLITAALRYNVNRFVSWNLVGEEFFPGNYYDSPRDDAATYLRAEMLLSF
jgi:hypothetical protein